MTTFMEQMAFEVSHEKRRDAVIAAARALLESTGQMTISGRSMDSGQQREALRVALAALDGEEGR